MIALLDTSSDTAVFALVKDEQTLFHDQKTGRFGASVIIPKMIEQAQEQGIDISQIEHWIVGKGPGSFTGTRVGIAFAHGVSTGFNTLMKGTNSGFLFIPELLTKNPDAQSLAILHDGRRDEVIVNTFKKLNNQWLEQDIFICKITEIEDKCSNIELIGSNMPQEKLTDSQAKIYCELNPHAEGLLLDSHQHPDSAEQEAISLQPIYVRPAVFVEPLKTRQV